MSLSRQERRKLDEIECAVRQEDPVFAAQLDLSVEERRRGTRWLARRAIWVGVIAIVVGEVTSRGLVSIGAVITLFGFIVLVTAAAAALRCRAARR